MFGRDLASNGPPYGSGSRAQLDITQANDSMQKILAVDCLPQPVVVLDENHAHSVALFAIYYNFVRVHKTLRTTPTMAANVTKRLWEIGAIVDVLEASESAK